MLKKYKNELLKLIEDAGMDPSQFKTSEDNTGSDSKFHVEYNDTGHRCHVFVNPENYHNFWINYTKYNPGFPWSYVEHPQRPMYNSDLKGVKHSFNEWLEEVKQYIEESFTPDLWNQLESQKQLITTTRLVDIDTRAFLEDEKAQIRLVVGEFRQQISEVFKPTEDQLQLVSDRLDYLVESTDRLNHFDWKALALNTLLAVTITLSLDTEKGKQLFEIFKKVFSGIVYLLQ